MKKMTAVLMMVLTAFAANALAAEKVGMDAEREAHRLEMKKIKQAQRETKKNAPAVPAGPHEKTFWEKEGERSGLGDSRSRMGSFMKNLNPMPFFKSQQEAHDARKASGNK
jgi:hypothetical protein